MKLFFQKTYMAMLVLFMAVSGNSQAADENLIAAIIVATGPTPCLDVVGEALADNFYQLALHAMLAKQMNNTPYAEAWRPGNVHYDQALGLLEASVKKEEKSNGKWIDYSSRKFLESILVEIKPVDQKYLYQFMPSKAGQFFWKTVVNGAFCAGFIKPFAGKENFLSAEKQQKVAEWAIKLQPLKAEFDAAPEVFEAPELQQIEQAANIFFSGIDAAQKTPTGFFSGFGFSKEKMETILLKAYMEIHVPLNEIFAAFAEAQKEQQ